MSALFTFRIDAAFSLSTDWVSLRFERAPVSRPVLAAAGGETIVRLPASLDLTRPGAQAWANRVVVEVLRRRAQAVLPGRFDALARRHDVRYSRVFIKNVRTRWGSCSGAGNVNLSLWLMLLPVRFVDYVLAHELAHLDEMNHGPRFWAVVDRYLGAPGAGRRAGRELRAYFRARFPGPGR